MTPGFAVWITGLPAAGKSTVTRALTRALADAGVDAEVLESDAQRPLLAPLAGYSEQERDAFYQALAHVGALLARHGVAVIFDATAPRRVHRDRARAQIPRFIEVLVECPLETCIARDPKGVYRAGQEGRTATVPGLQTPFEPPLKPDLEVHGDREAPQAAAARIVAELRARGWLAGAGQG